MTLDYALAMLLSTNKTVWVVQGTVNSSSFSSDGVICAEVKRRRLKAITDGGSLDISESDQHKNFVRPEQAFETHREALEYAAKRFELFAGLAG